MDEAVHMAFSRCSPATHRLQPPLARSDRALPARSGSAPERRMGGVAQFSAAWTAAWLRKSLMAPLRRL